MGEKRHKTLWNFYLKSHAASISKTECSSKPQNGEPSRCSCGGTNRTKRSRRKLTQGSLSIRAGAAAAAPTKKELHSNNPSLSQHSGETDSVSVNDRYRSQTASSHLGQGDNARNAEKRVAIETTQETVDDIQKLWFVAFREFDNCFHRAYPNPQAISSNSRTPSWERN